jgi:cytochrome c-type biogenesis protein CcmH/NrfG
MVATSNREKTLRKRFQQLVNRHKRSTSAASWYALGTVLADAYDESRELGRELCAGIGDPITCWRRCVKLDPSHAAAWHRLGRAYFELDDLANASRALRRAVKLDPHVPAAWNNLAILTMPSPGEDAPARVRRAEQYLRRAIEEDPRGKKLGWEPYAWLAEAAERKRDDPGALAWYAEANRRGDRYAAARKQVIEGHGARRRANRPARASRASRSNGG